MSKPSVTELLKNLKQQNKNDLILTDSEDIDVNDTITEVHSEQESDHQDIYDLIEEMSEKIKTLEIKIQKLEKINKKEKYYKESVDYVEQNKLYNEFFDIPIEQRTYKPIIKKEEIPIQNIRLFQDDKNSKNKNRAKSIRKSKSKNHKKYK